MHVHFLLPDIVGLPTGGNLYNERLEAALSTRTETSRSLLSEGISVALDADVVLIDSLVASRPEVRRLRRSSEAPSIVLLAHYLHVLDVRKASGRAGDRERNLLAAWDGIIVTSDFSARRLVELGAAPDRVAVARPGIDPGLWRLRERGAHESGVHLLTVSSILRDKGLEDLLDALAAIKALPWHWRLVGSDRLDPAYSRRFLARLDTELEGRATYCGSLAADALYLEYANADLFVLTSRFETCSMVTMEALAAGLPVVATGVGGIPEHMTSGREGILVEAGDREMLVRALESLIIDERSRVAMAARARRRGAAFGGWDETAGRVLDLIRRIVGTN